MLFVEHVGVAFLNLQIVESSSVEFSHFWDFQNLNFHVFLNIMIIEILHFQKEKKNEILKLARTWHGHGTEITPKKSC